MCYTNLKALINVFVYTCHLSFVDMNIAHISHTIYIIGDIGRKHEIGRCPPTVNICITCIYVYMYICLHVYMDIYRYV